MILAIDVGNTNIVLGCFDSQSIRFTARLSTDRFKTGDEYAVLIANLLSLYKADPAEIEGAILSSVVPPLKRAISEAIRIVTGQSCMVVGSGIKTGLNIQIDNPAQLGADFVAAAIGAGINITDAYGSMIVDIGAGMTDIAVLSLGRVIVSDAAKLGGDHFDDAIIRYLRRKHNLLIGERTAEELKINIGSAMPRAEQMYLDVTGRNLISGLPKLMRITSDEIYEAIDDPLTALIEAIHAVLEHTPAELAADVFDNGIVLSGGFVSKAPMAVMRGLIPIYTMSYYSPLWLRYFIRWCGPFMIRQFPFEECYFLEDAKKFRAELKCPLVYVGGLVSREGIDKALDAGFELVQMARALVNDPAFVNKLREGDASTRSGCDHRNYCIARMYSVDMKCCKHCPDLPRKIVDELAKLP